MDPADFRVHGYALVDWIAEYLAGSERYPVLPRVTPGDVRRALPATAPEEGDSFDEIFRDFERVLVPALTHWNHPGFLAYFGTTATAPGVLAEFLSAAVNRPQAGAPWWVPNLRPPARPVRGRDHRHPPVAPAPPAGAAEPGRGPGVRSLGLGARRGLGAMRVYASEQAHSSIDKAVIL